MNANSKPFEPYSGRPSILFPNMYRGNPQTGGYMTRNQKPSSRNSPSFKGRIWINGVGWFWLAGWTVEHHGGKGPYLSLRANPMSDEEAKRYCQPKQSSDAARETPSRPQTTTQDWNDGDIPF